MLNSKALLIVAAFFCATSSTQASVLCDIGRTVGLSFGLSDDPGAPSNKFYLYCPPNFDSYAGKFPTIILLHGGSFASGSPLDFFQNFTDLNGIYRESMAKRLADLGFVVAAPAYRFAAGGPRTAPYHEGMDDVARFADLAYSYVGIQEPFKIDKYRISILGTSAGGFLSMYEATRGVVSYKCATSIAGPQFLPYSAYGKPIEKMTLPIFGDGVNTPSLSTLDQISPYERSYNLKKVGKVLLYHERNDGAVTSIHSINFAPFAGFVYGVPLSKFETVIGERPNPNNLQSHLVDGDEDALVRILNFHAVNCR